MEWVVFIFLAYIFLLFLFIGLSFFIAWFLNKNNKLSLGYDLISAIILFFIYLLIPFFRISLNSGNLAILSVSNSVSFLILFILICFIIFLSYFSKNSNKIIPHAILIISTVFLLFMIYAASSNFRGYVECQLNENSTSCVGSAVAFTKNGKYCFRLPQKGNTQSMTVAKCLYSFAITERNPVGCSLISNEAFINESEKTDTYKDRCYSNLSNGLNDKSLCDQIRNEEEKASCLVRFNENKNQEFCLSLKQVDEIDNCLAIINRDKKSESICQLVSNKITDVSYIFYNQEGTHTATKKDLCHYILKSDVNNESLCNKIESKELREKCAL